MSLEGQIVSGSRDKPEEEDDDTIDYLLQTTSDISLRFALRYCPPHSVLSITLSYLFIYSRLP